MAQYNTHASVKFKTNEKENSIKETKAVSFTLKFSITVQRHRVSITCWGTWVSFY